jgi:hypothetical protein
MHACGGSRSSVVCPSARSARFGRSQDVVARAGDRLPRRAEGSVKLKYWILFVAIQAIGLFLPLLGNVHSNIAPILIGPILLLPGSLIGFFFPDSWWWGWAVIIGVNLTVWYFAVLRATGSGRTTEQEDSDSAE